MTWMVAIVRILRARGAPSRGVHGLLGSCTKAYPQSPAMFEPHLMLPCVYGSKLPPHHVVSPWLAQDPRPIKTGRPVTRQEQKPDLPPSGQDKFPVCSPCPLSRHDLDLESRT